MTDPKRERDLAELEKRFAELEAQRRIVLEEMERLRAAGRPKPHGAAPAADAAHSPEDHSGPGASSRAGSPESRPLEPADRHRLETPGSPLPSSPSGVAPTIRDSDPRPPTGSGTPPVRSFSATAAAENPEFCGRDPSMSPPPPSRGTSEPASWPGPAFAAGGPIVTSASPVAEKIALFRSLFKGREDLYALRWQSAKTGKSGYQPVCKNDWIRGLCRRPQVKCAACPAREFVPVTDDAIRRHIFGSDSLGPGGRRSNRDFVMGVYPLLIDETCRFIAADFDKASWSQDIAAFRAACARLGVPVAVERSRSGDGAHAWIFFAEPVPAMPARRLGCVLLTEALDLRPEIGLDSYDRLFPGQDLLPEGGFGSLIALPLQRAAAAAGHTLFIDEERRPFPDQWRHLSSLPRLDRAAAERIVDEAARRGRIIGIRLPVTDEDEEEPWRALPSRRPRIAAPCGPLPPEIEIVLGDMVYVPKEGLAPALRARIVRLASFQNPEFYKAQAMRLSTFGKPRVISCAEDLHHLIALPRGCLDELVELLTSFGIQARLRDERIAGAPLPVRFTGVLRPEQDAAVAALLAHDTGVLAAATAFGKTVVAARMIAARGVNTLVMVHRRQLLDQWIAQLGEFLDLSPADIGTIGAGKRKPSGRIDVALIQSLCRKGVVDDIVADYGHLVVDECHHIPAASFEAVARRSKARHVLGLSATVARKDGHQPIIFMQCGPVRFRVGAKQAVRAQPFTHRVVVRPTRLALPRTAPDKPTIHEIYDLLMADDARNEMIFEDVMACLVREKRSPLLITERRDHLEIFAARFRPVVKNVVVFMGGLGQRQRRALADRLAEIGDGEERLLIATGRYLGEGFDDARLDTLFLTLPISWRGTLAQYAGRLHRLHYNKREVRIYDYVDGRIRMLDRMFRRRLAGYRALGYETDSGLSG